MMNVYLSLAFFAFLLLSVIWISDWFANLMIKCFFIMMTVATLFAILDINGYIVKSPEPSASQKVVEKVVEKVECRRNFVGQEICKPVK
jgi:hypothetical protein